MIRRTWLHCFLAVALAIAPLASHATTVVDFEDLSLNPQQAQPAAGSSDPFVSHGVTFSRQWNDEFNCCPTGWAYSNQTNQTTPGIASQYAARVESTQGGGYQSSNFAVASNLQRGEAWVDIGSPGRVTGLYVTNSTYTYHAIVSGDDGAGFVKGPFVAGDWLRLDILGLNSRQEVIGSVPVYLADYRSATSQVIDEWTWIDLSRLGTQVARLEFEMSSTDTGPFGMNTPAYFAIDNLTIDSMLAIRGDLDGDQVLTTADIDLLTSQVAAGTTDVRFDVDTNGSVDRFDIVGWIDAIYRTWMGDANLDGEFNSGDFVDLFSRGLYETNQPATWTSGDFDGDGRFASSDLIAAFQPGGYEVGPRPGAVVVPEPTSEVMVAALMLLLLPTLRYATRSRDAICSWT